MKRILILFAFLLLVIVESCHNPTGPVNAGMTVALQSVTCTGAWIRLTANSTPLPVNVTIKRNNALLCSFSLTVKDTTLYDSTLSPNQTYTYTVQYAGCGTKETVTARTMDTTSHNITWQTYTFGGKAGSCDLYDVAIIDENNIWAVGEIYITDSAGNNEVTPRSAIQWDGQKWNLKIVNLNYHGYIITTSLYGVFAFSSSDIWFSSGVPVYYDGTNWTQYQLFDMGVLNSHDGYMTKICGTSSSNIYFIGTLGTITHYNFNSWHKIESGTTTDIRDIWGYTDYRTGVTSELCAVSFIDGTGDKKILKITGNKVDSLSWNIDRRVNTVWTKNGFPVYAGGDGIFDNKHGYWKEYKEIPRYYVESMRGSDVNDIYAVGDFGLLAHYNGVSWKVYDNLLMNGIYSSVAVKGNLIVAVGSKNAQAIITVGRRN